MRSFWWFSPDIFAAGCLFDVHAKFNFFHNIIDLCVCDANLCQWNSLLHIKHRELSFASFNCHSINRFPNWVLVKRFWSSMIRLVIELGKLLTSDLAERSTIFITCTRMRQPVTYDRWDFVVSKRQHKATSCVTYTLEDQSTAGLLIALRKRRSKGCSVANWCVTR